MKASNIMTRNVVTVRTDTTAREAISLLAEHHITSMPVLDHDDIIVGLVDELDLLRETTTRSRARPGPDGKDRRVREVMSHTVTCVPENADAADIAELLIQNNVRAVPIVNGPDLVGIVSRSDLLRTLVRDDAAIRADLRERLDAYSGGSDRWQVTVDDGIVSLSGHFDDGRQQDAAAALARTVAGVIRVYLHSR